jgi:hypothetical protein
MKSRLDLSFLAAPLAVAGTYKNDPQEPGYDACSFLTIVAELTGITGGTLDVHIQDSPDGVTWYDYLHFAQLAAGAAAVKVVYTPALPNAIVTIGKSVDPATPAPVLAAAAFRGGHPFRYLRSVAIAGAGASAGVAQTITIIGR